MKSQGIKRQSIYEQVIEHLKESIIARSLQPGDRLPTEAALAEELGVSRLSIREAIKVMESWGIVQTRPGDGSRLGTCTMQPLADHLRFLYDLDGVTLPEMATARRVLEISLLPLVVQEATEVDFLRMEEANAALREMTAKEQSAASEDMEFHLALASAAHNRALEGFSRVLHEFFDTISRTHRFDEAQWKTIEEHGHLIQALRDRDLDRAQEVLIEHLRVYEEPESQTSVE